MLIICQVKRKGWSKNEKLRSYQDYLLKLAREFDKIKFTRMSRDKNYFTDILTTLALMTHINIGGGRIQPINIKVRNLQAHYCSLEESLDEKPWYNNIKRFIQHREYPSGASKMDEKTLRRITMNYFLDCEILYKRLSDETFLKCMNEKKVEQAL